MRTCDETLELISAALDGALSDRDRAELDEHLSQCPACSALFEELRELHDQTAALEDVSAPAGFTGRVMDAIAADPAQERPENVIPFPAKKRSRAPWKGWAATAAVDRMDLDEAGVKEMKELAGLMQALISLERAMEPPKAEKKEKGTVRVVLSDEAEELSR